MENWILDLLFCIPETLRKSFTLSGIDVYLQNKRVKSNDTFSHVLESMILGILYKLFWNSDAQSICIPQIIDNWGEGSSYKYMKSGSMWQALLPDMAYLLRWS